MAAKVHILGLGADGLSGLSPRAAETLASATFLAGGRRHLGLVGDTSAETFAITDNIDALIVRLRGRRSDERCVVLASGDPLFYGIGDAILGALGSEQVRVESAVSSVQLAFARVGTCWQDAAIASVHGRPLKPALLPLLGLAKIGVLTRDGESPSEVAQFFDDRRVAEDYDAWVCADLGSPQESVISSRLPGLIGRRFSALNVVVLLRRSAQMTPPEPTDDAFERPSSGPVLLTHQDVRALVVRRFRGLIDGPVWDIGAGLGGVTVSLAREFEGREIVAAERSTVQAGFLERNRERFGVYNVRVVHGEAPECLDGEESPAGVFLGGSGGRLDAILNVAADRLRPGGRLVANFVGLENLTETLDKLRGLGWRSELTQVQLWEGRPLAGLTTLVPERPVSIVVGHKP